MSDNVTELPIVRRNPQVGDHYAELLATVAQRASTLRATYPFFHANVIRNALQAAIPTADGMIVDVGSIQTVGDCRYAITTTDHAGQKYRITVQVEK